MLPSARAMQLTFLRPRKPFLGIAFAAIAGISIADHWVAPLAPLFFWTAAIGLALLVWPRAWLCLVFSGVAFFALHTLQYHYAPSVPVAAELKAGPQPAVVTGVVWSEPNGYLGFRGEQRASLWLKVESLRLGDRDSPNPGMCVVRWTGPVPEYGDVVAVTGTARRLQAPMNPGEFDTAEWLGRQGMRFEVSARNESDCEVTAHGRGLRVMSFAIAARRAIKARLDAGLEDEPAVAMLIESMVLGLRGETPPEMKVLFQRTGTLHLFAVSGLHVAMLALITWYLLKPLRIPRAASFFIIVPVLVAYSVVTGLRPSSVRATIMVAFVLAAPLFERPAVPLNSLAAAAVAILVWDTNELFTPGFQLSFVLVLFIMGLSGPIARRMEPLVRPDDFVPGELWSHGQRLGVALWRRVSQAAGVTVSAWLGSFAFMAGYFHLVSPVAILANAIAVPLAFCILALGLMSLLFGLFAMPLSAVVNHANWLAAKLLIHSLALFARIPGGYFYVEVPKGKPAPVCELTALEVGEGAAIHIRAGSGDWLLDCGGVREYDNVLLPYLRSRGVNRLDGLILTHGDSAHLGAAREVFGDFRPRWVADTALQDRSPSRRGIHAELAAQSVGRRYLQRGDEVSLGPGVRLRVLYPPPGIVRSVADDRALACRIEAGDLRVLCVSDAGFFTERWLMDNEPDLRADVLVKGWHSRDFSGVSDFIGRVKPRAIVSSMVPFGSPPERVEEWQRAVDASDAELFPQDRCGAVRIELRGGEEFVVRSFVGNQIVRSRAR
jgi:ComEC/Rec2-related protein